MARWNGTRLQRLPERFWPRVRKSHGCWFWTGRIDRDGYGRVSDHEGRMRSAHVVAYELVVGPVPPGLELDHTCRVRHCVRPDHLEPVTKKLNCLRGISFAAENARKDVCAQGHPFGATNTYIRPNGHRDCRQCIRERARRYQVRKVRAA